MSSGLLAPPASPPAGGASVEGTPAVDPLSDLLRAVRLDGAYFYAVRAADSWSIETVPACDLTPRILPASEHLISYHVVLGGRCYGGLTGERPVELIAGDVIVFPQGDAHLMSSDGTRVAASMLRTSPDRFPTRIHLGTGSEDTVSLLCGCLGCDRRPFNPLLAALPRQLHIRGLSNSGIGGFMHRLNEEARQGQSGAVGVLTRMAELLFVEVLRRHLEDLPPGQTGWLAGLRDELVGRALTLLHTRPGYRWSIADLARASACSRSALIERFTELVGQPPMRYLAQWRMQVAATRLMDAGTTIAGIAAEVGYDSEAAFSRAFKKATGLAPGSWRATRRRS